MTSAQMDSVLSTVAELRGFTDGLRAQGRRVGLVPTMGALHVGHLALVERARQLADEVVVTVFVNPTQFGPNEDFERYPRTLERDVTLALGAGASRIFAPSVNEMYPPGEKTRVVVSGITDSLCGASRPGHFAGVSTVVTKLFAATGPCVAVFGRKDYQQLKVIERMTRDLLLPVEIVGHPTVREADGLALSSRNQYLTPEWRSRALAIPRALAATHAAFLSGERSVGALRARVKTELESAGLRIDYATFAHPDELTPYADEGALPARALLAVAAFADATRLIDNVVLGEDTSPLAPSGLGGAVAGARA
jgi:pantoate--beta-alanine ligase